MKKAAPGPAAAPDAKRGAEEEGAQHQNGNYAVFSVLSHVLEKDDISPTEFEEKDRPKDDYIDHELLRTWFSRRLKVAKEHDMSLREIWRNFCYEYRIYCSLPLFGNVVLRHVLQAGPAWKSVTKVGDIKQKRYNLTWVSEPPGTEEQIDAFFGRIKEEKEKVERPRIDPMPGAAPKAQEECPSPVVSPSSSSGSLSGSPSGSTIGSSAGAAARPPIFLDPSLLADWWVRRLEPTDPALCRMRMRDIYERFVAETGVNMPKALFGELSVRYVLSTPAFALVVRKGKIHSKRYSLQWRLNSEPKSGVIPALSLPLPAPTVTATPASSSGFVPRSTAPPFVPRNGIPTAPPSNPPAAPQPSQPAPTRGSPPTNAWGVPRGATSSPSSGFSGGASLFFTPSPFSSSTGSRSFNTSPTPNGGFGALPQQNGAEVDSDSSDAADE